MPVLGTGIHEFACSRFSLAQWNSWMGRPKHDHDGSENDLNHHFLNATFEISYDLEPPGVTTST
jgi:hypothetical protein